MKAQMQNSRDFSQAAEMQYATVSQCVYILPFLLFPLPFLCTLPCTMAAPVALQVFLTMAADAVAQPHAELLVGGGVMENLALRSPSLGDNRREMPS